VALGWDFVGDAYNADETGPTYNPVPSPDPYPDDCAGHSTHVAGIIGANGQVKGVAPDVSFAAYRIFGCQGSASDDLVIAAMETAAKDKVDVINMSLGNSFGWAQSAGAKVASRLVKKGIVVFFDNSHVLLRTFTVSAESVGFQESTGARRGTCTFHEKVANAQAKGAACRECGGALPAGEAKDEGDRGPVDSAELRRSGGAPRSMVGEDVAYLLVHLNHQSSLLRMEVKDAATGKSLGLARRDRPTCHATLMRTASSPSSGTATPTIRVERQS
jgi:hypothetical protein